MYLEEYVIFAFLVVIGAWLGARRMRAEGNYQTLFHAVSDAITVHDARTGQTLDVNTKRGAPVSHHPGRPAGRRSGPGRRRVPPYLTSLALDRIRRAPGEGPATFEWLSRHLDDAFPVLDRSGAALGGD